MRPKRQSPAGLGGAFECWAILMRGRRSIGRRPGRKAAFPIRCRGRKPDLNRCCRIERTWITCTAAASLHRYAGDLVREELTSLLHGQPRIRLRKGEVFRAPDGEDLQAGTGGWVYGGGDRSRVKFDEQITDLFAAVTGERDVAQPRKQVRGLREYPSALRRLDRRADLEGRYVGTAGIHSTSSCGIANRLRPAPTGIANRLRPLRSRRIQVSWTGLRG